MGRAKGRLKVKVLRNRIAGAKKAWRTKKAMQRKRTGYFGFGWG
jgi:hypothetical protein